MGWCEREDPLGWSGLLIEPGPEKSKKLKWNRPRSVLVQAAVSEKEEDVEFLGKGATAGMARSMADSFKKSWHSKHNPSFLAIGSARMGSVRSIFWASIRKAVSARC